MNQVTIKQLQTELADTELELDRSRHRCRHERLVTPAPPPPPKPPLWYRVLYWLERNDPWGAWGILIALIAVIVLAARYL